MVTGTITSSGQASGSIVDSGTFVILQSYNPESNTSQTIYTDESDNGIQKAQTFTASDNYIANKVVVCMYRIIDGAKSGELVRCSLQDTTDGEPNGHELAYSEILYEDLAYGTPTDTEFVFNTTVSLVKDTVYAIVFSNQALTPNAAAMPALSTGGYVGGHLYTSIDTGASWTEEVQDLCFSIYGEIMIEKASATMTSYNSNYTLKEYYNANDNTYQQLTSSSIWYGQTFTTSSAYTLSRVKVKLYEGLSGTVPNITLSIRATSTGLPTGADLCSKSVSGSTLTSTQTWYDFELCGYPLLANTKYAIIVRHDSPVGSAMRWRVDATGETPPNYALGNAVTSPDSGANWSTLTRDLMFEVYGADLKILSATVESE